jgi:hypothetical protein
VLGVGRDPHLGCKRSAKPYRPRGLPRWTHDVRGTSRRRPLTPSGLGTTARAARLASARSRDRPQPPLALDPHSGPLGRQPNTHVARNLRSLRSRRTVAAARIGPPARRGELTRQRALRWDPAGARSPHARCRFLLLLGSVHPRSTARGAGWLRGCGLARDSWPGGQPGGGDVTPPRPWPLPDGTSDGARGGPRSTPRVAVTPGPLRLTIGRPT